MLRAVDPISGQYPNPTAPDYYDASWAFILEPLGPDRTRLIVRSRGATRVLPLRVMNFVLDFISFIMEERMLRGIKQRAEGVSTYAESVV